VASLFSHCEPAYTYYAFFEWSLIFLDVLYDGITEIEFKDADFQVSFPLCILLAIHSWQVCVGMALNQGFNGSGRAATDEMYRKLHRLA
jgi:hypothetical protein